ncbi:MAG TPA: hypothetical protein VFV49_09550 [Thermoanaerobaculia bacterium]|nr:hypothetical protein [Thermoanaerobaculia bacterium]
MTRTLTSFLPARSRSNSSNMETTDATGELPLYNPDTYARALESGRVPGRRSTNGR